MTKAIDKNMELYKETQRKLKEKYGMDLSVETIYRVDLHSFSWLREKLRDPEYPRIKIPNLGTYNTMGNVLEEEIEREKRFFAGEIKYRYSRKKVNRTPQLELWLKTLKKYKEQQKTYIGGIYRDDTDNINT